MTRKRPRSERQNDVRKSSFRIITYNHPRFQTMGAMLMLILTVGGYKQTSLFCCVEASSNGFPGTLQGSSTSASALSENWWLASASFESSSSSEWDWEEPDDATMSSSDAGETSMNNNNNNNNNENSVQEENGTEVAKELLNHQNNKTLSPTINGIEGETKNQTLATIINSDSSSSSTANTSAENTGKNKPLQTLEKLQQMLDETDYMTTGRTTSRSNDINKKGGAAAVERRQDELWTSKDRSKYKKQQKKSHLAPKRILEMVEEQSSTSQSNTVVPSKVGTIPPPPPQTTPATAASQQQQQQQGWYPPPPPQYYQPHFNSANGDVLPATYSEAETTEQSDTDGDGLGYTLPNLPIYLSDNEDEGNDDESDTTMTTSKSPVQNQATTTATTNTSPPRPQTNINVVPHQANPHNTPSWQQHQQQQQQQQQQQYRQPYQHPQHQQTPPPPPPQQQQWYGYPYVPPPPPTAYQQQQQQQQQQPTYYSWGPPPPQQRHLYPRSYVPRVDTTRRPLPGSQQQQQQQPRPQGARIMPSPRGEQAHAYYYHHPQQGQEQGRDDSIMETSLSEETQSIMGEVTLRTGPTAVTKQKKGKSGLSILWNLIQIGSCISWAMFIAYSAIPGRDMSMYEFNQRYSEILRLVAWTSLPPLATFWFGMVDVLQDEEQSLSTINNVVDDDDNDENLPRRNPHKTTMSKLISAFYNSFTWGYCLLFALQVAATTFARLAIFFKWERPVFDLSPRIPVLIIPWVLRENGYKPKRITLIVQDFVASCLLSPILEEYLKVVLLQMTKLPKNFQWKKPTKHQKKKKGTTRQVAELVDNPKGEVTNVNAYISNMLAVTLGIKLADSIRRVCMYTKPQNAAKTFYAIFRGVFPVRELCGAITALGLARRDVLGQHAPLWKILLPATVIHGMANFRGMKPVFKWNSATPWVEMQLSPPTVELRSMKRLELFNLVFPKVLWLIILIRVTGYCVKNYFMVNRQAVKRTTTYAGKHSAFSAELAATEMLKASNKKGD